MAALERTLEQFNAEMGQKVAQTLHTYHLDHVTPLEARVAWLELPWYKKLWDYGHRWWTWLWARKGKAAEGQTTITEIDHEARTITTDTPHEPPLA